MVSYPPIPGSPCSKESSQHSNLAGLLSSVFEMEKLRFREVKATAI
jgi:hypothetical protein